MRVTQMNAFSVKPKEATSKIQKNEIYINKPTANPNLSSGLKNLIFGFEKDDYILLGIIAVLIWEGCDDYILLAALGYLFFMGVRN